MSALEEWNENYQISPSEYLDRYGEDAKASDLAREALEEMDEEDFKDTAFIEPFHVGEKVEVDVSRWKDQRNYECPLCPYSALEKDRLEDHLRGRHSEQELREQRVNVAIDRFGNIQE